MSWKEHYTIQTFMSQLLIFVLEGHVVRYARLLDLAVNKLSTVAEMFFLGVEIKWWGVGVVYEIVYVGGGVGEGVCGVAVSCGFAGWCD